MYNSYIYVCVNGITERQGSIFVCIKAKSFGYRSLDGCRSEEKGDTIELKAKFKFGKRKDYRFGLHHLFTNLLKGY
jgi:hypothetical protein